MAALTPSSFSLSPEDAATILLHLNVPSQGDLNATGSCAISELAERLQSFVKCQGYIVPTPPLVANSLEEAAPVAIPSESGLTAPIQPLGPAPVDEQGSSSATSANQREHSIQPQRHRPSRDTHRPYPTRRVDAAVAETPALAMAKKKKKKCKRDSTKAPPPSRNTRRRAARHLMDAELGEMGDIDVPMREACRSRSSSISTEVVEEPMEIDEALDSGTRHVVLNRGLPMEETVKLCDFASELVYGLRAAALDCTQGVGYSRLAANMHHMMRLVVFGGLISGKEKQTETGVGVAVQDDQEPLVDLAVSLHRGENMEALSHLEHICQCMEFAAYVQMQVKTHEYRTRYAFFNTMVAKAPLRVTGISAHQLNRYYNLGAKSSLLAEAGSVYMVMLLAICRGRSLLISLSGDMVAELTRAIRWPDDSSIGRIVKHDFIPAVLYLRTQYPIGLDLIFSQSFLSLVGGTGEFDGINLPRSDAFFNYYNYNIIDKPRCTVAWKPILCLSDPPAVWNRAVLDQLRMYAMEKRLSLSDIQDSGRPDSIPPCLGAIFQRPKTRWDNMAENVTMMVINTQFQSKVSNRIALNALSKEKKASLTRDHKRWAASSSTKNAPSSFTRLRQVLVRQLELGKKKKQNIYTYVDAAHFPDQILKINDANNNLVAMLIPTMPQKLREDTFRAVRDIYQSLLKVTSTSRQKGCYKAIHYSVWNRYSKRGEGVPVDAHPSSVRSAGKAEIATTRVSIPRESEESKLWQAQRERLRVACAPFFAWVENMLRELLPQEFSALEVSVNLLPVGDSVLCHPFASVVVNFNVTTTMHIDDKDKEVCVVFQLSDCTGGELCLAEPGIVFRLRNGDGVIFKSGEITHFNLDYQGERVSFVFHSDSDLDSWAKDYNGWGNNRYFRSTQSSSS